MRGASLKFVFLALLLLPISPPTTFAQEIDGTLMAVFAHPDDEVFVSPILARYAREGRDVYLVIATEGEKGVRDFAGIPAGEALARVRTEEAACAAERLGIHPPIHLGYEDAGLASFQSLGSLRNDVTRLLAEHRPDVVLTFGPDGGTGHPDHRLVSSVVTEVVQGSAESPSLYYVSLPAERMEAGEGPMPLHVTPEQYLTVRIPFEDADRRAARESFACHASQFNAEEQEGIFGLLDHVLDGRIYLRPGLITTDVREDLFP